MNIPQPCARRAHRNPPNDVHSPNVGRIYPIPINKLNVTFCNINILVLGVNCQHFGNVCQLEGFCAPFGRRVGEYVWSGMYIFLYVYLYWI